MGGNCDVDICASHPCLHGATCVPEGDASSDDPSKTESFQCLCVAGFSGHVCDLDLCASSPCLHGGTCVPTAQDATSTDGGYTCTCPPHFVGDRCGTSACDPNPCNNGGVCHGDTGDATGLVCTCAVGFTGPRCETVLDPCSSNPCGRHAECRSVGDVGGATDASFECDCDLGLHPRVLFKLDRMVCGS